VVTQYLKKTFRQDKIFVIGHSWGSLIGVMLVQKYPTDYAAFISIAQFVNPGKSEMLSRNHVIKQANLQKDTATLNALATIPFSEKAGYKNGMDDWFKFRMLSEKYLTSRDEVDLPNPMQLYSDYSVLDWMTPAMRDIKSLFSYMNGETTNLFQQNKFKLPVYFFVGKHDYITSGEIAQQYFRTLKAPKKKLFVFEHSGHAPHWQEATLFHARLLEVVAAASTN
jgi:pimeloyl-ACP methyl ester carboxylesterase